jgi:hypothetical protein
MSGSQVTAFILPIQGKDVSLESLHRRETVFDDAFLNTIIVVNVDAHSRRIPSFIR